MLVCSSTSSIMNNDNGTDVNIPNNYVDIEYQEVPLAYASASACDIEKGYYYIIIEYYTILLNYP